MDDLDGKAPESDDIIRRSLGIRLVDKKRGLRDWSDSDNDFEANLRLGGRNKHETITPTNVGVSLGDDFFDDIHCCSTELANLNEVVLYFFLFFFWLRDNITVAQLFIPNLFLFLFPLFFIKSVSLTWCTRLHLLLMRIF